MILRHRLRRPQHPADQPRQAAQAKRQTLTCHVEPDLGPVPANQAKLYDVLRNLVDNAVLYGGRAKVRVDATETRGSL